MIEAALRIINAGGIHSLTNRRVAELAGVNVAAISYHFGSQQGLINEALGAMTGELRAAYDRLGELDVPAAERLATFIADFTEACRKNPEIVRNPVDLMMREAPFDVYGDWMRYIEEEGILAVASTFRELYPEYHDTAAHVAALNLISCLAFPHLAGSRLRAIWKVDLDDPAVGRLFTESVVARFVPR
nr:TetR family transcriptional regulator [Actinomycetales bacterium]